MTDKIIAPSGDESKGFPTIRGQAVRIDAEGRILLNDVWRIAGSPRDRNPYEWSRLPDARKGLQALSMQLERETGKSRDEIFQGLIHTKRGGNDGGTWAHPNLALQYAGYLSPDLRVEIHDVFLRFKLADPELADDVLERASPEENEWAARRALSRATRNVFTKTLEEHNVTGWGFADCTNANYRGLMGKTATQLREERGLAKGANVRDFLSGDELVAVTMSEVISKKRIKALNSQGNQECAKSCYEGGSALRRVLDDEDQAIADEMTRRLNQNP